MDRSLPVILPILALAGSGHLASTVKRGLFFSGLRMKNNSFFFLQLKYRPCDSTPPVCCDRLHFHCVRPHCIFHKTFFLRLDGRKQVALSHYVCVGLVGFLILTFVLLSPLCSASILVRPTFSFPPSLPCCFFLSLSFRTKFVTDKRLLR